MRNVAARRRAWSAYIGAASVAALSMRVAASYFPGDFDWRYRVVSALASRKHNPAGAVWFAAGIFVGMLLLWFVVEYISGAYRDGGLPLPRFVHIALRVAVIGGALVGLDRLVFFHLSDLVRKGHEILALLSFAGWFVGLVGAFVAMARRRITSWWPVVLVVAPLVAVGLRELTLYLAQRGIGWADVDWRAEGISWWLSFAFWQWIAVWSLGAALGYLLWLSGRVGRLGRSASSRH